MCEIDQQGEPTAPRRDSVLCGDLNGEEIQKGGICKHRVDAVCATADTNTIL